MSTAQPNEHVTVLVPHDLGVEILSGVDGLRPVPYVPDEPLPDDAATARVLVAPFLASSDAVRMTDDMPRLELVQLLTAGAEAWIGHLPDGVALSDGRGAHGGATAEWVVSVLLAVYRHLDRFVRAQDRGVWDYHQTEELAEKKIMIIGAGDVGERTRARLEPFDVEITMVGRSAREGVHGWDELPDLLPRHDATVLIVPLTDETRGMVDADFLAAMPDGSLLVNGSRGPVCDTDALLAELQSGRIRAAVDVTDPEPLPDGHPLFSAPGLLLTPHVGGSVPLALRRAYRVAAEQIEAFARGEQPPNLVTGAY